MGIYVGWLADAAKMTGFPVIEVHGWRTRDHGGFRAVEGVAGHHTATSARAKGDYPSQNMPADPRVVSSDQGPAINVVMMM